MNCVILQHQINLFCKFYVTDLQEESDWEGSIFGLYRSHDQFTDLNRRFVLVKETVIGHIGMESLPKLESIHMTDEELVQFFGADMKELLVNVFLLDPASL